MDSDSQASESGIPLAQFDADQQQMVYLTSDGSSYILPAQSGAEGEGLVTYIYGGDGTNSDTAGDMQGSDSDIQYLLVSADEASGLEQQQFVVMPPESTEMECDNQIEEGTSKQLKIVSPEKKPEVIKLDIGKKSESTSTIIIAPSGSGSESVGTTAEVKVKGGTARVTILPATTKSPAKGTTASSSGVTTIPIRFVSRSDSSSPSTQTISLPVKSTPKVTVSVKSTLSSLPPAIVSLPKVTVISATSASSTASTAVSTPKKLGRPRKDAVKEEPKDPLHQLSKPGGVSKSKSPNVIVVPIQISKEMIAAKQSGSEAKSTTKSSDTPVSSDSEKEKPKGKVGVKEKGSPSKDKGKEATPAAAKSSHKKQVKAEPKSTEPSPTMLPTRRSKRESNLSSKLAEWGLLPTSGNRHSAAEDDSEDDDDDDDEDEDISDEKDKSEDDKDKDKDDEEEQEEDDVPLAKTIVVKVADKTPKSVASTAASTSKSSAATPAKSTASTPSTSTKVTASTSAASTKTGSSTPAPSVKTAASASTPSVTPKVTTVSTPAVKVATSSASSVSVKKTVTIAKESGSQTPIVIKPNTPMVSTSKILTPSTGILKKTPAPSTTSQQSSSTTPKLLQNKSLMCKPIMMTKATSCNPIRITKATQTDEDADNIFAGGSGSKTIVPLPVPIFVPTPMAMFSMPTPYPMPVPLPIPVPCFVPTTRNSIAAIMKQLQELHDSLPSDPFEADVLKMAEAVAEARDEPDHSNERKPFVNGTLSESLAVIQQDGSSDMSVDVLEMALRMASETGDDSGRDTKSASQKSNGFDASSRPAAKRPRLAEEGIPDEDDINDEIQQPLSSPLVVAEPLRGPAPAPILHAPINDAHMRLKYSYGINAWKQWVTAKNAEIEASGATRTGARGVSSMKLFKNEILQCGSEELSIALSHFVRELRKPTEEKYSPDSIYYLCLGIQHYLFENGRIDNIFADVYYERFNDALHELLSSCEVRLNTQGLIICRVSEEHLWEARQLGAHSPRVLLHTLVYFNTKYFMLQNAESHMALSFSNILKQWKKNTNTADGKPIRSVYLRYNTIGYSPTQQGSSGAGGLDSAIHRRRTLDPTPFEQLENVDNPLRCPVKLYEFYLSKCPESIRNRNDVFYLTPEPSCVPSSPVWYSAQPLSADLMNKMLGRIRVVREIQESQLNQAPIVASTAATVTASMFG